MTLHLIVNPSSRSGRAQKRQRFWQTELARRGKAFVVTRTCGAGDALRAACESAAECVVAVGGDGTINEVAQGVLLSGTPKRMGVLYAGTSPDFCRFQNIPFDTPQRALDVLLQGRVRRVDAVRIASAFFVCSANIGLGADVAAFANRHRRFLGDTLGTGLGVAKAMLCRKPFAVQLTADGVAHAFDNVNHLVLLKNPWIASGLKLAIPHTADDGHMTVAIVRGLNKWGLLRALPKFYSAELPTHPAFTFIRARRVTIDALPRQPVEFDGDPHDVALPCDAEVLPQRLPLITGDGHA